MHVPRTVIYLRMIKKFGIIRNEYKMIFVVGFVLIYSQLVHELAWMSIIDVITKQERKKVEKLKNCFSI